MKKKLLSLFALLLFAVQGVWAEKWLYADVVGTTMTLKYGEVPEGKPYYDSEDAEHWVVKSDVGTEFMKDILSVTIDASCKNHDYDFRQKRTESSSGTLGCR